MIPKISEFGSIHRANSGSPYTVMSQNTGQRIAFTSGPQTVVVQAEDTLLSMVRKFPVDMVVLSTGLEPRPDAADVRRLFNIGFGPVALAFVGVSGPEVRARIGEIRKMHGDGWISEWLRVRGVQNWADYFETKYEAKQSA